jgi:hypothetical protein
MSRIVIFILKRNDGCLGTFYLSSTINILNKTVQQSHSLLALAQLANKKQPYNERAVNIHHGHVIVTEYCSQWLRLCACRTFLQRLLPTIHNGWFTLVTFVSITISDSNMQQ